MSNLNEELGIVKPINQVDLFGYKDYFLSFVKLYNKNKLPNIILLSGPKGIGKATFAYHFINYLFSQNEENTYSIDKFQINPNNKSYLNICNKTHPNFFLLENEVDQKNIKIDNVRKAITFLNKTTFNSDLKVILIDNVELLNVNSSNSLLKSLEEVSDNTFFFLIHDSSTFIQNTIKSRSIEFKISFKINEKQEILNNIIENYKDSLNFDKLDNNFYFNSPGNTLKFLIALKESKNNSLNDKKSCILSLIDKYKKNEDVELLNFISFVIEAFYNDLALVNTKNINYYFFRKNNIIKKIVDMKKYNLDKKNLFYSVINIIENE